MFTKSVGTFTMALGILMLLGACNPPDVIFLVGGASIVVVGYLLCKVPKEV